MRWFTPSFQIPITIYLTRLFIVARTELLSTALQLRVLAAATLVVS